MFSVTATRALGRQMIATGKNIQWAGRQVMIGLTLPLVALGVAATRGAEEFDKQITRVVKVTNLNLVGAADEMGNFVRTYQLETEKTMRLAIDSIERQTNRLVDIGAGMGFMADETSKLAAEFSQMGFAGFALDGLSESALRLSRVSGADLADSMNIARLGAMAFGKTLGDGPDSLVETFARLNLIENQTSLSLAEMAGAIPIVAGVARNLSIEMETLGGMLALMKDQGIEAREGATSLRTGLIRLVQDATDPAIKAFEKLGVSIIDLQEANKGQVFGLIVDLAHKLNEVSNSGEGAAAKTEMFIAAVGKMVGTRAASRFTSMLQSMGDSVEKYVEVVEGHEIVQFKFKEGVDETGFAFRALSPALTEANHAMRQFAYEEERVQKSLAGQAEILRAQLNVELRRFGRMLLPIRNRLMEFAVSVVQSFNNLSEGTQKFIGIAAAMLGVLGPATMIFGVMTNAMGQLLVLFTRFLPALKLTTVRAEAEKKAFERSTAAITASNVAKTQAIQTNNALAASTAALTGAVATQNAVMASTLAIPGAAGAARAGSVFRAGITRGTRTPAALGGKRTSVDFRHPTRGATDPATGQDIAGSGFLRRELAKNKKGKTIVKESLADAPAGQDTAAAMAFAALGLSSVLRMPMAGATRMPGLDQIVPIPQELIRFDPSFGMEMKHTEAIRQMLTRDTILAQLPEANVEDLMRHSGTSPRAIDIIRQQAVREATAAYEIEAARAVSQGKNVPAVDKFMRDYWGQERAQSAVFRAGTEGATTFEGAEVFDKQGRRVGGAMPREMRSMAGLAPRLDDADRVVLTRAQRNAIAKEYGFTPGRRSTIGDIERTIAARQGSTAAFTARNRLEEMVATGRAGVVSRTLTRDDLIRDDIGMVRSEVQRAVNEGRIADTPEARGELARKITPERARGKIIDSQGRAVDDPMATRQERRAGRRGEKKATRRGAAKTLVGRQTPQTAFEKGLALGRNAVLMTLLGPFKLLFQAIRGTVSSLFGIIPLFRFLGGNFLPAVKILGNVVGMLASGIGLVVTRLAVFGKELAKGTAKRVLRAMGRDPSAMRQRMQKFRGRFRTPLGQPTRFQRARQGIGFRRGDSVGRIPLRDRAQRRFDGTRLAARLTQRNMARTAAESGRGATSSRMQRARENLRSRREGRVLFRPRRAPGEPTRREIRRDIRQDRPPIRERARSTRLGRSISNLRERRATRPPSNRRVQREIRQMRRGETTFRERAASGRAASSLAAMRQRRVEQRAEGRPSRFMRRPRRAQQLALDGMTARASRRDRLRNAVRAARERRVGARGLRGRGAMPGEQLTFDDQIKQQTALHKIRQRMLKLRDKEMRQADKAMRKEALGRSARPSLRDRVLRGGRAARPRTIERPDGSFGPVRLRDRVMMPIRHRRNIDPERGPRGLRERAGQARARFRSRNIMDERTFFARRARSRIVDASGMGLVGTEAAAATGASSRLGRFGRLRGAARGLNIASRLRRTAPGEPTRREIRRDIRADRPGLGQRLRTRLPAMFGRRSGAGMAGITDARGLGLVGQGLATGPSSRLGGMGRMFAGLRGGRAAAGGAGVVATESRSLAKSFAALRVSTVAAMASIRQWSTSLSLSSLGNIFSSPGAGIKKAFGKAAASGGRMSGFMRERATSIGNIVRGGPRSEAARAVSANRARDAYLSGRMTQDQLRGVSRRQLRIDAGEPGMFSRMGSRIQGRVAEKRISTLRKTRRQARDAALAQQLAMQGGRRGVVGAEALQGASSRQLRKEATRSQRKAARRAAGAAARGSAVKGGLAKMAMGTALGGAATIAIPIILALGTAAIANPEQFKATFMKIFGPALETLKKAWDDLTGAFRRLMETIRGGSDDADGFGAKMARAAGVIAGFIAGSFTAAISAVVSLVGFIVEGFTALVKLLQGDGAGAAEAWGMAWRRMGASILDLIANLLDALGNIPFVGKYFEQGAKSVRGWANGMRETVENAERIPNILADANKAQRDLKKTTEQINDEMKETQEIIDDLVEFGIIEEDLVKNMIDAVTVSAGMSAQQLADKEANVAIIYDELTAMTQITDEQKAQIAAHVAMARLQSEIAVLESDQAILQEVANEAQRSGRQSVSNERLRELDISRLQLELDKELAKDAADQDQSVIQRINARINGLRNESTVRHSINDLVTLQDFMSSQINEKQEELGKIVDEVNRQLQRRAQFQQMAGEATADEADEMERLSDAADDARRRIQALQSAMGEVMGDVRKAFDRVISDQEEFIDNYMDSIADAINEYFDNFQSRFDEQTDMILDSLEERADKELELIDDIADAAIEKLEKEMEEEERLEKKREEFFRKEKARIDFLTSRRAGEVRIQEEILRGNLAQAAILQIEQRGASQSFYNEIVEEREAELKEARDQQRQELIEALERERQFRREQVELALEAAQQQVLATRDSVAEETNASREASLEQERIARETIQQIREAEERRRREYLRGWERVTPATEEEFRQHTQALTDFMNESSRRLQEEINQVNSELRESLVDIDEGFVDSVNGHAEGLDEVLENSRFVLGEVYDSISIAADQTLRSTLELVEGFIDGLSDGFAEGRKLAEAFAFEFERDMSDAVAWARNTAADVLKEEDKWAAAGEAAAEAFMSEFRAIEDQIAARAAAAARRGVQEGLIDDDGAQRNWQDMTGFINLPPPPRFEFLLPVPEQFERIGARVNPSLSGLHFPAAQAPEWAANAAGTNNVIPGSNTQYRHDGGMIGNVKRYHTGGVVEDIQKFHTGGFVGKLKSSEVPAVLEKGEYVIQKSAVAALGTNFLDKINKSTAMFSPASRGSISVGESSTGSAGVVENTYNLSFQIDGGNIDEQKLAQRVMFEIKKVERSSGGGRRIGA
jgi:TP901 family phage tail tape measure protein